MRSLLLIFLMTTGFELWADNLPEWLIPLREAVYEQQLKADDLRPLYETAKAVSVQNYTGTALDMALSYCEYFMGRVLEYDKRHSEASVYYDEGMRLAEKVLEVSPSAEAWVLLAENLSQSCAVRSWAYVIGNGLNVEKFAKNALALNSRSAGAKYCIAARWVYAPFPLYNHRKGTQMMEAITTDCDMYKDDSFQTYSAIGYGYIQQKKYDEARFWILKALEVYPTNKYAAELFEMTKK